MTDNLSQESTRPSASVVALNSGLAWELLFGQGQHGWRLITNAEGENQYVREISPSRARPITVRSAPYSDALYKIVTDTLRDYCSQEPLRSTHLEYDMKFIISEKSYKELLHKGLGISDSGTMQQLVTSCETTNLLNRNDPNAVLREKVRHALFDGNTDRWILDRHGRQSVHSRWVDQRYFDEMDGVRNQKEVERTITDILANPPYNIPKKDLIISPHEYGILVSIPESSFPMIEQGIAEARQSRRRPGGITHLEQWREQLSRRSKEEWSSNGRY